MISLAFISNIWLQCICLILFLMYYCIICRAKIYFVVILLISFIACMYFQPIPTTIHAKQFKVEEIRDKYIVASNQQTKVYVHNVTNVAPNDIIQVQGTFQAVRDLKNSGIFNFETFSHQQDVYFSIYATSFTILKKSQSVKALVYRYISSINQNVVKKYLLQSIYHIKDDSPLTLVFIGGFHLQCIAAVFARILHKDKMFCQLGVVVVYGFIFPIQFFVIYLFMQAVVAITCPKLNAKNKLGVLLILLLLYNAKFVYMISFMLRFAFALLHQFNCKKIKQVYVSSFILIPIQLFYFHEFSMLYVLLFPLLKWWNNILFILALVCLVCSPCVHIFDLMVQMLQIVDIQFDPFILIGKPSFIWISLWGYCTLLYISYKRHKHFIYLLVLLVYHSQMAHLNIFGEVVFMDQTTPNMIQRISGIFERNPLIYGDI